MIISSCPLNVNKFESQISQLIKEGSFSVTFILVLILFILLLPVSTLLYQFFGPGEASSTNDLVVYAQDGTEHFEDEKKRILEGFKKEKDRLLKTPDELKRQMADVQLLIRKKKQSICNVLMN